MHSHRRGVLLACLAARCLYFLSLFVRASGFIADPAHTPLRFVDGSGASTSQRPQRTRSYPSFISRNHHSLSHRLSSYVRGRVEIPLLLDLEDARTTNDDDTVVPNDDERIVFLPSSHLPDELRTLNVYGMQIVRPVQQMVIDRARENQVEPLFGQVVRRKGPATLQQGESAPESGAQATLFDSLVGAIGCAGEVLVVQPATDYEVGQLESKSTTSNPSIALCRGSFRFVVREVVSSIPYPVAIVEELGDDPVRVGRVATEDESSASLAEAGDDDDEDDDDNNKSETNDIADPAAIVPGLLQAMREYVDLQVKEQEESVLSPLEVAILQDSVPFLSAQKEAVEEMAAVFDIFQSTLVDLCPLPADRYYAIAMMAAELGNLDNASRRTCLSMTDGVRRMQFVLDKLEGKNAMTRARKVANDITRSTDDQERDLQVGEPTLPSWARQIRKGMQVEYYWNEEYGWCLAEVVDDPLFVVDELIITLYFPGDGTTHRLPFTADDKVRWRPPRND